MLGIGVRVVAVALVALVAAVVLGWPVLVAPGVALLGAAYAVRLALDDTALDPAAPLVAAGLFLVAELAYWSLERREPARPERGEELRRLAVVCALGLGALVTSSGLLALTDAVDANGLAIDLAGAAAAFAVLLVVADARRG